VFEGFTVSGGLLPLLHAGECGVVSRLTAADGNTIRQLADLGITCGTSLRVLKQTPEIWLQVGDRSVALTPQLGRAIYVRTSVVAPSPQQVAPAPRRSSRSPWSRLLHVASTGTA